MTYTGDINNSITVLDWTNARLVSIDIGNGSTSVLAAPSEYPDLLAMASMRSVNMFDLNGLPSGVAYYLQDAQDHDNSPLGSSRVQLILFDEQADGVINQVTLISP